MTLLGATSRDHDPVTGTGRVVLDDGRSVPYPASAFAASGLRLLRPGQRLEVQLSPDGSRVEALGLPGGVTSD